MKFLAMLGDSWRETLDSKLFYVLIGLSGLVVLLVGSITYRPVPLEEAVPIEVALMNMRLPGKGEMVAYNAIDVERLDEGGVPWQGDSRFICEVLSYSDPQNSPAAGPRHTAERVRENFQSFTPFQKLEVSDLPSTDPAQVRFRVTTHGTNLTAGQQWYYHPCLFFGLWQLPIPFFTLQQIVRFFGYYVVGLCGAAFTMLVSTIITAFFIPNMLARGTLDLLLVKPLGRVRLFLYKFTGGLLFILVNTIVIMTGIWLALRLQSGLWVNAFLLCILVFSLQFAILYAVSAFVAVLTRSAIVAMFVTLIFWGMLFAEGWIHWLAVGQFLVQQPPSEPHGAAAVYDSIHKALPRYKELDWLISKEIKAELIRPTDPDRPEQAARYQAELRELETENRMFTWTQSVAVSCVFIVAMLGLACWRFATRDY
jgi:ABC-type transport system involved in multi-copper enzyme maturation permease subunit